NPEDFEVLTRMLVHAAGVPLALVLEGGYGPSHGEAVRSIFAALMSEGAVNTRGIPSGHTKSVVSYLKSEHDLF
ncbi:MAG TPA: histone deacetylase, partial [Methanoregula sp.]|nr:histone deacetylase [Methanoregula sp.]